jgi:tripartite-type tricarboxylate transporter receptor subunit TctC
VPPAIVAKISTDLNKALNGAALKKRLEDQAIEVTPGTPDQFLAHIKAETAKWTKVVKEAGLEER